MEKIIIISGPSASGKSTLINKLIKNESSLERIKTYTTRENRDSSDEYNFISIEEFKALIDQNRFIEWEEVYEGNFYGTLMEDIKTHWLNSKIPVLVMDVKGALKIKQIFKEKALTIFVQPSKKEDIIDRLKKRSNDSNIDQRIKKIEFELSFNKDFDKLIINDDLLSAISNLKVAINEYIENNFEHKTLVVNLLGGPSSGKSKLTGYLFALLKFQNINCEQVPEYAKDVVWDLSLPNVKEQNKEIIRHMLSNQIDIFGNQHKRLYRLLGKVDVVITDSPLIMQLAYSNDVILDNLIHKEFNKMNNLNIFLNRVAPYNPAGRTQTKEEAQGLDPIIKDILIQHNIPFHTFDGSREGGEQIFELVMKILNENK